MKRCLRRTQSASAPPSRVLARSSVSAVPALSWCNAFAPLWWLQCTWNSRSVAVQAVSQTRKPETDTKRTQSPETAEAAGHTRHTQHRKETCHDVPVEIGSPPTGPHAAWQLCRSGKTGQTLHPSLISLCISSLATTLVKPSARISKVRQRWT